MKKIFLHLLTITMVITNYTMPAWGQQNAKLKQSENRMINLYMAHDDMASDKWANYLEIYDANFLPFVNKKPVILEIGVQNGGSLQIYSKYFENAQIYGIDINPDVCKHELGQNIKTFCFDIKNKAEFDKALAQQTFNIVIDDGSHRPLDIIQAFEFLFEKVQAGGIYLVEDTHTSYWKDFDGGLKRSGTAMEYFKQLADYINYYHLEDQDKKLISAEIIEKYVYWIESITFYDSVIVIKKSKKAKTAPYKRIVTGTKQPVVPILDIAKKNGWLIQ